jgi:hypothetical protein
MTERSNTPQQRLTPLGVLVEMIEGHGLCAAFGWAKLVLAGAAGLVLGFIWASPVLLMALLLWAR